MGCNRGKICTAFSQQYRYFIGLPEFPNEAPYVHSLLVEFRKRFDDEVLAQINEMIITYNTPDDQASAAILSVVRRVYEQQSVEFGAKLDLSIDENRIARLERLSFDAYNGSDVLIGAIERYKEQTGHYPQRVLADKIYRNKENLSFCRQHGIRLFGPALGRPGKNAMADKNTEYTDKAGYLTRGC